MASYNENSSKNAPLGQPSNTPLRVLVQCDTVRYDSKRRYTKAQEINALAVGKYKTNGRGITFQDLMYSRLVRHKSQAQNMLKRCLAKKILFVIEVHKPQQYFPSSLKAEILKTKFSKNASVRVTEVPFPHGTHLSSKDAVVMQTLEGYVLPILRDIPLHIHKIQLKLELRSEYYSEIPLSVSPGNKNKEYQEIAGPGARVRYLFYPNGRVMVFVACSNTPFKLERDDDLGRLIAFLGAVRDRLVVFLRDIHERAVPDIMQWYLTECEINKDVKVSDWLQATGLNIQVRHGFHIFRLYIKAKGEDTLCRVEESISPKNKSAIEAISDIFNPNERLEKQIAELVGKVNQLLECFGNKNSSANELDHNKTRGTGRWGFT